MACPLNLSEGSHTLRIHAQSVRRWNPRARHCLFAADSMGLSSFISKQQAQEESYIA